MQRQCGECTLCCRLVPVGKPLHKKAGERCRHQRYSGCAIYAQRPMACQLWTCKWLTGEANTRRPDRVHYVIDNFPDFVTMVEDGIKVPVVQVWCDERHPTAYRDPDLLAFLEQAKLPALVRINNERGIFLVPPCLSHDGKWFEKESIWHDQEHSAAEIMEVIS